MKRSVVRLIGLTALAFCGCGKGLSQPALVPVSGKVTLNGHPLAGAHVTFMPIGNTKGSGSTGRTDADGVYELTAVRGGAGAVPGEYRVVISKLMMPDGSDFPAVSNVPPIESPARQTFGPEYSDAQQSRLTATVSGEGGSTDFHLTTATKAP